MLVVHMDSGLGNQMLDYAEYLAIKESNPDKECYLENIVYDIPCEDGMFAVWNGYELDRIFGINPPNIKDILPEESYQKVCHKVVESKFWEEGWNFAPHITKALNEEGIKLNNLGKAKITDLSESTDIKGRIKYMRSLFFKTSVGYHIKRILRKLLADKIIAKDNASYDIFRIYPDDSFVGHSFKFKYKGFGIERIDEKIREAFKFPVITDERNLKMLELLQNTNSVSIHARRSDLLFLNGHCYEHGYFRRAVRYIKKHVANPVFVFFTDENSIGWCEENEDIFGLDFAKDKVEFVTWNKGESSYIDMYLMSQCKHNIFTESTFGFWGAYLNTNPNKITCAPDPAILATHSF